VNSSEVETDEDLVELENIEAEVARRHLSSFVRIAWPIIESVPLVWNWHLDVLCDELERMSRGEIDRLLINVPPGTMKSLLVSVFWPAWEWTRDPKLKYLAASYSADLSTRDTMKVRDLLLSAWYRRVYGVTLRGDQSAKTWIINDFGGWRIATSTGGRGTGEHPDRIIIDDPHSATQSRSEVERKAALDWYDQTISSRGATRGVKFVVIMQRLHQEDMAGHLLSLGGWRHRMFPMRFELERADIRDERNVAGELLWPALFPEEKLRVLERDLGPYGVASQMQQRPAPIGGGLFKRIWFPLIPATDVPKTALRCRGWDTAATEGAGDYTTGVRIAWAEGIFYVEDVVRGQWGPDGVDRRMMYAAKMDGRGVRIREEKEPGAAGKTVCIKRARDLVGYDYRPVPTTGDKEVRANTFRAQCEAGNVRMVQAPWNETYLQELEVFPNGTHDDQVDASSAAFNDLATGPRPLRVARARWG